jgi:ComF family protein
MVRLSVFESPFAELITRFKYYHGWSIGELLAERAVKVPRVRAVLDESDVLVPVPLHPTRQVVRGFNQARVFADRVGALAGVKVASPVIRVQRTPQQALLHARERVKNVRGAFAVVSDRRIKGKRVTLVDDVFTSASTLKEVARVIQAAQPAGINVLTIAAADPKGRAFEAT